MYKFIGLYLLIILGIFVEPEFLGSIGNAVFKLFILAGVSYLLYDLWNLKDLTFQEGESAPDPLQNIAASQRRPVFENIPIHLNLFSDDSVEIQQFLLSQFAIYWNYTLPRNGFLLYRYGKQGGKIFYQQTTDNVQPNEPDSFSRLISLADQNNAILIENNVENAGGLFPFYQPADYKPGSLLAFKTKIDSQQTLYWFFDSDATDFFNIQDKALIEQINSNTLFALVEAGQNLSSLNLVEEKTIIANLAQELNHATNSEQCLDLFAGFLTDHFEASKLSIALKSHDSDTAVIQKSIGLDDSYTNGTSFNINEGVHGWVILKNKPYLIDNIDKGDYFIPRFTRAEKTNFSLRSFLSVPLQMGDKSYGMVSLEHKLENKYSENDKQRLIKYSEILSSAFRRYKKI